MLRFQKIDHLKVSIHLYNLANNSNYRNIFELYKLIVELQYSSLKCSNDDKIGNEINLLKTPVIVPYYLFPVTKLRNVLFINFLCYFTEFKVCQFKFVFII